MAFAVAWVIFIRRCALCKIKMHVALLFSGINRLDPQTRRHIGQNRLTFSPLRVGQLNIRPGRVRGRR
jgi:hypothetical protein